MASYLVTGASRGLGLSIVTRLAALPPSEVAVVFATSRQAHPASLTKLSKSTSGRVVPIQLDPADAQSLKAAVQQVEQHVQGRGLDVLVNNSGIQPWTGGRVERMENLTETFDVNVNLTHLVMRAFLPLLRQGQRKVVANITSTLGSITLVPVFQGSLAHAYKISKAGLNMLTSLYAADYAHEGFTFFVVSPGWLRTDMGGSGADLPVETGADEVIRMLRSATPEDNGRFRNIHAPGWEGAGSSQYDGKDAPW